MMVEMKPSWGSHRIFMGPNNVMGLWGKGISPTKNYQKYVPDARFCPIKCSSLGHFFVGSTLGVSSSVVRADVGNLFMESWRGTFGQR